MKLYQVAFTRRAEQDLDNLAAFIEEEASETIAWAYIDRLEAKCASLERAPLRGTSRADLGQGFRTIGFEKRVTILFVVKEDIARVEILSVFYGGREISREGGSSHK